MIEDTRKQRGGFRIGFLSVFGLAMALILLYVLAPAIAGMAPGLEPALASYVDWANSVRLAIDGWLRGLFGGA